MEYYRFTGQLLFSAKYVTDAQYTVYCLIYFKKINITELYAKILIALN